MGSLFREVLTLHSLQHTGFGEEWRGTVGHYGLRRRLTIKLWAKDIDLLQAELGITLTSPHEFAEPVEFFARQYTGKVFEGVKMLNGREFKTTVATVDPAPVLPESKPANTEHMKYHGETVTVLSCVQQNFGNYKVWTLKARAEDGFFFHKISAWAEHEALFTAAGYPKFPERGAPAITLNADAVIEYVEKGKVKGYRVVNVYPQAWSQGEPALTVVEKPAVYRIPVIVDPSWEDEIAALQAKVYELSGILDTDEIPVIADTATGLQEGEAA
jgi:hypothetical protein